MEIIKRSNHGWFEYVMAHREKFYDKGFVAMYLSDRYIIMFWKCV